MFTKKTVGISILATLAFASSGCVADSNNDETTDTTDNSVTGTEVLGDAFAAVGALDAMGAAIAAGNPLGALAALGTFTGFFGGGSNYAELSPATIAQISSQTADAVVAQIDRTNMNSYIQNGKDDVTATWSYTRPNCTPGAATSTKPRCNVASLQNAHTEAVSYFNELNNDWSNMKSLQQKSPALAMMSAKTMMLVGAARVYMHNEVSVLNQLTTLTSNYNTNKSTFKFVLSKDVTTYRTELKSQAQFLNGQFKPALDRQYTVNVCTVATGNLKDYHGCVTDPSKAVHRTTDYRNCENDWELGWLCDKTPADSTLISEANALRDQLQKSGSPSFWTQKRNSWLGASFDKTLAKL